MSSTPETGPDATPDARTATQGHPGPSASPAARTEPHSARRAEPTTAHIGRAIQTARHHHGWSQQQLANTLTRNGHPTNRSLIADLESGRRHEIGVSLLVALAAALRTPPGDLLADRANCPTCHGQPYRGYRCLSCGAEGRP